MKVWRKGGRAERKYIGRTEIPSPKWASASKGGWGFDLLFHRLVRSVSINPRWYSPGDLWPAGRRERDHRVRGESMGQIIASSFDTRWWSLSTASTARKTAFCLAENLTRSSGDEHILGSSLETWTSGFFIPTPPSGSVETRVKSDSIPLVRRRAT